MNTIIETNDEKLAFGEYVGTCWNCAGKCVGKINGKYLFSTEGKCIGHFNDEKELYDCQTHKYIGELAEIHQNAESLKTKIYLGKGDTPFDHYNEFERMIVALNKTELQDEFFECFSKDEGFIDESILIAINLPEGYKDFEI